MKYLIVGVVSASLVACGPSEEPVELGLFAPEVGESTEALSCDPSTLPAGTGFTYAGVGRIAITAPYNGVKYCINRASAGTLRMAQCGADAAQKWVFYNLGTNGWAMCEPCTLEFYRNSDNDPAYKAQCISIGGKSGVYNSSWELSANSLAWRDWALTADGRLRSLWDDRYITAKTDGSVYRAGKGDIAFQGWSAY